MERWNRIDLVLLILSVAAGAIDLWHFVSKDWMILPAVAMMAFSAWLIARWFWTWYLHKDSRQVVVVSDEAAQLSGVLAKVLNQAQSAMAQQKKEYTKTE